MYRYNSINSTVLATFAQADGNVRMLVFHRFEKSYPGHEYELVIGSYFDEKAILPNGLADRRGIVYDDKTGSVVGSVDNTDSWQATWNSMPKAYEWSWGHYFDDVVHAVDYWKREVLGIPSHEPEHFWCPDCSGVYQEHPIELDYEDGTWSCPECGCSTSYPEEDCCIPAFR